MKFKKNLSTLLVFILSLAGSFVLSWYVPWDDFLLTTVPSGGDNPAHPYMMKSLAESFFQHFSVVHYATGFWNGFELFQFYFPLPYLAAGILSQVVHPSIAFKSMVILGPLTLPFAFFWMSRWLNMSVFTSFVASCLGLGFLYTEAHVMWGGNMFSNAAGMIGNQWGFAFFLMSFGLSVKTWKEKKISTGLIVLYSLTALCHFYALLMLLLLNFSMGLTDSFFALKNRSAKKEDFLFYLNIVFALLLISWWFLPLLKYISWSTEFSGSWNIQLLTTFTKNEKIIFVSSIVILLIAIWRKLFQKEFLVLPIFTLVALFLYFAGPLLKSNAFIDVRLWPTLYFSLYLIFIYAAHALWLQKWKFLKPLPLVAVFFLFPQDASLTKASGWYSWNWKGIENKAGWKDYSQMIEILNQNPGSRVVTELTGELDRLTGSSRGFELIPYLSQSEIPIGGIVNSATYAGVGYSVQCLLGEGCAGNPVRSFMPEIDLERGINKMKVIGAKYLIVATPSLKTQLDQNPRLEKVVSGEAMNLYRLREAVSKVEVYQDALPKLCTDRDLTLQVNLIRWDFFDRHDLTFPKECSPQEAGVINNKAFFNFLVDEWLSRKASMDRGWADRSDRLKQKTVGFLFSHQSAASDDHLTTDLFEPFIAFRNFDSNLLALNLSYGNSEVAMPLMREFRASSSITLQGQGYKAYLNNEEIPWRRKHTLPNFKEGLLTFKKEGEAVARSIEVYSDDPYLISKFPVPPLDLRWPEPITDNCQPQLEVGFHEMTLKTNCPGKPHVLKYSYYPKWTSDVPIEIGNNGFMVLTPKETLTVLRHGRSLSDWLAIGISILGLLALVGLKGRRYLNEGRSSQKT